MSDEQPPTIDYASPHLPNDWTTVKTYFNPLEAELAAAALQREGIRSQIFGATANATLAVYGSGIAKIQMQVPSDEAESARLMLDSIEAKRRERMQPKLACPKCSGTPVRRTPFAKQLLWGGMIFSVGLIIALKNGILCLGTGILLILAVFYPIIPKWQCRECLTTWRAPEPEEDEED